MDKVFISYSRDDHAAAELIAERLRAAGFDVFFDAEGIVAGDSWSNQIDTALDQAAAVLVLLSSHSRRSSWVQDELQSALESKKMVVPVLLDDGATQNWLWPLVATRQSMTLDMHSPTLQRQLDELARCVGAQTSDGRHDATLAASSSPGAPAARADLPMVSSRSAPWRTISIAIASALLGALVVWMWR